MVVVVVDWSVSVADSLRRRRLVVGVAAAAVFVRVDRGVRAMVQGVVAEEGSLTHGKRRGVRGFFGVVVAAAGSTAAVSAVAVAAGLGM